MSRARANDYDKKKNLILNKAAALIARKGFDQATMMDVAQACNTSKSHIYHYFPKKEDLLYEIVHEHITQQVADLQRIVALPLSAEERFTQFVDSFMQGAVRGRDEHIILMNDVKQLPRAQLREIRALEVQMAELLETVLVELNPELMSPPEVHKPYTLLLYGMMIWTLTWYRKSGPLKPTELAARIAHLLLHGFTAAPPALSPETNQSA
ncbi:MAG: TetR/AcrR family transcriptional regulator [Pigmentiphaga sp.]|nr:TetR/AcrR family transcriptional regulator [Pigmentiphaga sp.]